MWSMSLDQVCPVCSTGLARESWANCFTCSDCGVVLQRDQKSTKLVWFLSAAVILCSVLFMLGSLARSLHHDVPLPIVIGP